MAEKVELTAKDASWNPRVEAILKLRRDASRLASKANKRVERLERNGFTDSPAYKTYLEGGGKFGVRGKTYNEVQAEVARLNRFLDSQTSTIKGVVENLKTMAANTGIKYESLNDLKSKASKFFELASKTEQYLRNVEDAASAIGYQKIWEAINEYTQQQGVDLASTEVDIDEMLAGVTAALDLHKAPETLGDGSQWFYLIED